MRIGLVLNPSKGGWERALEGVVAAAQAAGWPDPDVHLTTREDCGHLSLIHISEPTRRPG